MNKSLYICSDPPDKDLSTETKQEDGKLYIDMSMKVHPLPNCTINYGVCENDFKY